MIHVADSPRPAYAWHFCQAACRSRSSVLGSWKRKGEWVGQDLLRTGKSHEQQLKNDRENDPPVSKEEVGWRRLSRDSCEQVNGLQPIIILNHYSIQNTIMIHVADSPRPAYAWHFCQAACRSRSSVLGSWKRKGEWVGQDLLRTGKSHEQQLKNDRENDPPVSKEEVGWRRLSRDSCEQVNGPSTNHHSKSLQHSKYNHDSRCWFSQASIRMTLLPSSLPQQVKCSRKLKKKGWMSRPGSSSDWQVSWTGIEKW